MMMEKIRHGTENNEPAEVVLPKWTLSEELENREKQFSDKPAIISFCDVDLSIPFQNKIKNNYELISILQHCFQKCSYVVERKTDNNHFIIKSSQNKILALDNKAFEMYISIDGSQNMWELFGNWRVIEENIICCTIEPETFHSIKEMSNCQLEFSPDSLIHFLTYMDYLFRNGFIILEKVKRTFIPFSEMIDLIDNLKELKTEQFIFDKYWTTESADIFLFGDKVGVVGVGILYLASHLNKKGIKAKCLFVNDGYNYSKLKGNIIYWLKHSSPRYVGLSMKWFPHIERVYDMAKIIKQYDKNIKVIVGGDTASYYADEVIQHDEIDFVVCGDGEQAIEEICINAPNPVNTYYKNQETVIPPLYRQANDGQSQYDLLPLDQIVVDPGAAAFTTMFIPTSKGCCYQCVQCGGTKKVQEQIFKRKNTLYSRSFKAVRNDMINTLSYTTAYMFSIGDCKTENYHYFYNAWNGLELKNHFLAIFHPTIIDKEIVKLAVNAFRYVRFAIDICSLSQRQREEIHINTNGKPYICDEDILNFLEFCQQFSNCEVDIYTIAGMPFCQETDKEDSKRFLQKLKKYSCFHGVEWGRLHAQPGALLSLDAEKYGMVSAAKTYDDFLRYSKFNQNDTKNYPDMQSYHYPYIDAKDSLNSQDIYNQFIDMSVELKRERRAKNIFNNVRQDITYKDLNQLSDQFAKSLIKQNINKGDRVILFLQDRISMSIVIWATIKVGCIYIPLDTQHHMNHIESILKYTNSSLVITDINELDCINKLAFDSLYEYCDVQNCTKHSQEDKLYIIYSSGTTNRPKCISIRQNGIINYTNWRIHNYGITDKDIVIQLLSEAFDGFASNFYTALLSGATLIMPTSSQIRNIPFIVRLIDQYKVTHTSLLPFFFDMLLTNKEGQYINLKSVVLAGEVCTDKLVDLSFRRLPNVVLYNEYGPAENSVASTSCRIEKGHVNRIGKAISGVSIYILDEHGNIAEKKQKGEIALSGIGLYDGYYPEKAKLIMTNFNEYVYLTGDTGCYDDSGNIEFLGRYGRTVKISGMLIDMDSIEKHLNEEENVKEAAVDFENGQIVARIVLKKGGSADVVKKKMKLSVPSYMVPTLIIMNNMLPRLPAGKVDYISLKNSSKTEERDDQLQPTQNTLYQKQIIALWKAELGKDDFGTDDNFFDIGGNSLMVMKIFDFLDAEYPDIFSPTDLFTYHTINKLSKYMEEKLN